MVGPWMISPCGELPRECISKSGCVVRVVIPAGTLDVLKNQMPKPLHASVSGCEISLRLSDIHGRAVPLSGQMTTVNCANNTERK